MNNRIRYFDLASFILLAFIFASLWMSLYGSSGFPNHDNLYHLTVANGFMRSGGWTGWDWWDAAPFGRPQLYPPLFHLILAFLQKLGFADFNAARLIFQLLFPLFFWFFLWFILKALVNNRFAFLTLLTLSSSTLFYESASGNIPACLALIFGLSSWLFLKKQKFISATLCLTFSFYSHAAMPWFFFISLLYLAAFNKEYRKLSLGVAFCALSLSSSLIYHIFSYREYFNFWFIPVFNLKNLFMVFISRGNPLIWILGLISIILNLKNKAFYVLLFLGYVLGSYLMFSRYSFRFFYSQGFLGVVFFFSLLLERFILLFYDRRLRIFVIIIVSGLIFVHPALYLKQGKLQFKIFSSSYRISYKGFKGLINQRRLPPVLPDPSFKNQISEVIKANTSSSEIICANYASYGHLFFILTGRPTSNFMLGEVKPKMELLCYYYAKIIIGKKKNHIVDGGKKTAWEEFYQNEIIGNKQMGWKKIYDDEEVRVFLNPNPTPKAEIIKAKINFKVISLIFLTAVSLIIWDLLNK